MKTKILFSLAFVLLLIGCKKETPTPSTVPVVEKIAPLPKIICYAYDGNGSKIELEMQTETNSTKVYGTMSYALAEKDKNGGTFTGNLEHNILIVDYHFYSEGVNSTRQVAFKLEGDKLIEGYGEMTEDGTRFKDVSKLKFDSTMPLTKVDCAK